MADIYEIAAGHAGRLASRDRAAMAEIMRAYGIAWQRVKPQIAAVADKIERKRQAGETVSPAWLFQFDRFRELQAQIESEMREIAIQAAEITTREQGHATDIAISSAVEMIRTAEGDKSLQVTTNVGTRLATGAISSFVGFAGDGSPLREMFDKLGGVASMQARNAFVEALALGYNPTKTARHLRDAFGGNTARALTVARTETMRAHREATRQVFDENRDVVKKWAWTCAASSRTCAVCFAMSGQEFDTDERMQTHPNCRCVMIPITETSTFKIKRGDDLFRDLDESDQRAILGPAKFQAWQAGKFQLRDLVGVSVNPKWGVQRFERSLKDVVAHPVAIIAPRPRVARAPVAVVRPVASGQGTGHTGALVAAGRPEAAAAGVTGPGGARAAEAQRAAGAATTRATGTVAGVLRVEYKAAEIKNTITQIDKLHAVGDLPTIPVKRTTSKKKAGAYSYQMNGTPIEIKISTQGTHKGLTTAHEIGHFIDHQAMNTAHAQRGRFLSSSSDPMMKGFKEATQNSQAIKRLVELRDGAKVDYTGKDGITRPYTADRRYARYLLREQEIWARAYAQYVAVRSNDTSLMNELAADLKGMGIYPRQWSADEFEPIAKEIDKVFAALGWAH